VGSGFTGDLWHGGSSYQILFRNFVKGWSADATPISTNYYQRVLNLWNSNLFYTVVGNVMGSANIGEGNSKYSKWRYEFATADAPPSSDVPAIYRLGHMSVGPSPEWYPATVDTLFRHGNFDFANTNVVDWQSGYATNLPPSLYLTTKPAWFGNLAWPPIGPEMPDVRNIHLRSNLIPAQARFFGRDYGVPYSASSLIQGSGANKPLPPRLYLR
jgi:hypothetical protein